MKALARPNRESPRRDDNGGTSFADHSNPNSEFVVRVGARFVDAIVRGPPTDAHELQLPCCGRFQMLAKRGYSCYLYGMTIGGHCWRGRVVKTNWYLGMRFYCGVLSSFF